MSKPRRRKQHPKCSRATALFLANLVREQRKTERAKEHFLVRHAREMPLTNSVLWPPSHDLRVIFIGAIESMFELRRFLRPTLGDVAHLVKSYREAKKILDARLAEPAASAAPAVVQSPA